MSLQIGDNGNEVRALQQRLMSQGYNVGRTGADGKFGANTQDAVRQFQSQHQLKKVDGIVGPETRSAFQKYQTERHTDTFTPGQTQPTRQTTGAEPQRPGERPYQAIQRFAEARGFRVTSTTGGQHAGAGHRDGRAVDVSVRGKTNAEVERLISDARAAGYWVNDERRGGNQFWTAPHIHIEQR